MGRNDRMNRDVPGSKRAAKGLSEDARRRRFLKNCAKFAAGTPPAVALLMSASRAAGAKDPSVDCSTNPAPPPGRCSGGPPGQG